MWVKVQNTDFKLRGLTVGEYLELIDPFSGGSPQLIRSMYIKVAVLCVEGWEGITVVDDDGRIKKVEFSKDLVTALPESALVELGQIAYGELSVLSQELSNKVKGYIHFLYYLDPDGEKSDNERVARQKRFECKSCIESGAYISRRCGLSDRQRREISDKAIEIEKAVKVRTNMNARYGGSRKKKRRQREEDKPVEINIILEEFDFPECPISWIDQGLEALIDRLMYCNRNKITYFDGGLASQSNRLYQMIRLIESTSNEIDRKRMKKPEGRKASSTREERRNRKNGNG